MGNIVHWHQLTGTVTPRRPENEKTEEKLHSLMRRRLNRRRCRTVTLGEFTLGGTENLNCVSSHIVDESLAPLRVPSRDT